MDDKIVVYTDGACSGNPGVGGWGVLIINGNNRQEYYGGSKMTTNNKMEMLAVIRALEHIGNTRLPISIWSDSQYVIRGVTEWMKIWKRMGWRNSMKEPVKNQELWVMLDKLCGRKEISWHWIKGHNGHPENERVDELARRGLAEHKMGEFE